MADFSCKHAASGTLQYILFCRILIVAITAIGNNWVPIIDDYTFLIENFLQA